MRKNKITPEEYKSILKNIKLEKIYSNNFSAKFDKTYLSNDLSLDVKESNSFKQDDTILYVDYTYRLVGKNNESDKNALNLKINYVVEYSVLNDIIISKEFMKIFSEITISLLLWTYFREFVSNSLYRMGLPPLTLPMKRI